MYIPLLMRFLVKGKPSRLWDLSGHRDRYILLLLYTNDNYEVRFTYKGFVYLLLYSVNEIIL